MAVQLALESIMGVDPISATHVIHNFDNLGYARTYTMRGRGRTWTTVGIEELTRRYFHAYETKDRGVVEALLSRDFSFTSPYDIPPIDRANYFERCWPGSETTRAIRIDRVLELDNEAVVRYELERTNGERFENMEVLRFEGDKLASVQVYFGECPK